KASEEPLNGLEQLLEFSSMLLDPILGLLAQTATSTCQATIRKGCRVVRGPDWKWAEQDGGEGHTGTILQHTPQKKHVVVLWDSGECCEYRVGDRERFDLRLLDSAPAGIRHINAKCSECLQAPLFGPRWQCSVCQGYDLCSTCYHTDQHELSHSFFRIDKEISRP
ncbi:E3 ubiquitin-protein ligase mind-bomb, partial [Biomphalaria glabrata]